MGQRPVRFRTLLLLAPSAGILTLALLGAWVALGGAAAGAGSSWALEESIRRAWGRFPFDRWGGIAFAFLWLVSGVALQAYVDQDSMSRAPEIGGARLGLGLLVSLSWPICILAAPAVAPVYVALELLEALRRRGRTRAPREKKPPGPG